MGDFVKKKVTILWTGRRDVGTCMSGSFENGTRVGYLKNKILRRVASKLETVDLDRGWWFGSAVRLR